MDFEHKKFGKCVLKEINQKMLEDFHRDMQGKGQLPMTVYRGDSIRSAIKHGIIVEPKWTPEEVDNANPGHIKWLTDNCLAVAINEASSIDPLS